ncbi:hypothetical protein N0V95_004771 [Ascochyta clinopodiicola]|nr:hypothetical protein N0V95_004771 [Ascochyta clinopodiicola]
MESKRRGCVATVNDMEDKAQAKKLRKDDAKYEPRFSEKLLKMFPNHVRKNYYAMGNVHAAIMFGPLLIENGVASLPQATRDQLNNILVVSGDDSRELYSAEDKTLRKRRLNASITQVLGGLFSTHESTWRTTEETVIEMVLQAAKDYKPQMMLQQRQQQTASLLQVADHIVALLKNSIGRDVRHYLHLLLYQIPDRRFPLEWKLTSNNCQTFCDNLLRSFLTVFPPNIDKTASSPLTPNYLLSFTARFPALSDATFVASRLDSYFRAFHRELDIIDFHDSETEYPPFNDSEFELVNCERILLWKCMGEECNLADHMFRHASDSISILKFHVKRPRTAYWRCAPGSMRPQQLDHGEWLRQRVQVMLGIDIFHGLAAGIVQTFRRIAHSVVEEDVDFIDAEEFEAEEQLPYASVETWEGNHYIDPDTGLERRIQFDKELFSDSLHDSEERAESRYGVWSPGSSDKVGRKGPQWMADTEASERMVLIFRNTK